MAIIANLSNALASQSVLIKQQSEKLQEAKEEPAKEKN
jgi:hypothetical protein